MIKQSALAILLSGSYTVLAAEAVLVGQGEVRSAPDYVELTIVVDSKCYSSPQDARKVNDDAARKIVDFLNTKFKKTDAYNAVIATGGYTSPFQFYYQDKYYCQNTFQKLNTIVFKTQDMLGFESLFNEIQNVVFQQFSKGFPALIQQAMTSVSMSDPAPNLSQNKRAELEQKAMNLAYQDAQAKLQALFGAQPQNLKLRYVSELPPEAPIPYRQRGNAPMAMMAGAMEKNVAQAPVQFEDQTFNKTLYFTFSFDDLSVDKK